MTSAYRIALALMLDDDKLSRLLHQSATKMHVRLLRLTDFDVNISRLLHHPATKMHVRLLRLMDFDVNIKQLVMIARKRVERNVLEQI